MNFTRQSKLTSVVRELGLYIKKTHIKSYETQKTYRIVFDTKTSKYWAEFLSEEKPAKRFSYRKVDKDSDRENARKKLLLEIETIKSNLQKKVSLGDLSLDESYSSLSLIVAQSEVFEKEDWLKANDKDLQEMTFPTSIGITSFNIKDIDDSAEESVLSLKKNYVYFFADGTCSDLLFSVGPTNSASNIENTKNSKYFSLNPLTGTLSTHKGQAHDKT